MWIYGNGMWTGQQLRVAVAGGAADVPLVDEPSPPPLSVGGDAAHNVDVDRLPWWSVAVIVVLWIPGFLAHSLSNKSGRREPELDELSFDWLGFGWSCLTAAISWASGGPLSMPCF